MSELHKRLKEIYRPNLYGILNEYILPPKIDVDANFRKCLYDVDNLVKCRKCRIKKSR